MNLEQLAKLINTYFELDDFFKMPDGKRPRQKVKARRMFFLFANQFQNHTIQELSEKYWIPDYSLRSDIRIIKGEIEVNPIIERQFNELKDAFNAQKEPFIKSVDYEKGKKKGIEIALNALKSLL